MVIHMDIAISLFFLVLLFHIVPSMMYNITVMAPDHCVPINIDPQRGSGGIPRGN